MKKFWVVGGIVVIGIVGVMGGVSWWKMRQEEPVQIISLLGSGRMVPTPGVYLQRPSSGLKANVVAVAGEVKLIPWDRPDEFPASAGGELTQGDEVRTGEDGRVKVDIDEVGKIEMERNTSVTIGSLLAETLTVRQDSGLANYKAEKNLAVRVKGALAEVSGQARVNMNGLVWRVDVMSGFLRLAYVDVSGKTRVWEVRKGKWAIIDDARRRVRTTGRLVATD